MDVEGQAAFRAWEGSLQEEGGGACLAECVWEGGVDWMLLSLDLPTPKFQPLGSLSP